MVIHGYDFSHNRIDKVFIVDKPKYLEQVEKIVDSQTTSSSNVSVNNPPLKIIIINNDCSK